MPIGWFSEGGGRSEPAGRESDGSTWADRVRERGQEVIQNLTGAPTGRDLVPTVWTRWATAFDERVCPVCAPYAGRAWPEGEGPQPPLHPHCRCERRVAFVTWATR